jgi:alpha-N-acetylglucosaminidase
LRADAGSSRVATMTLTGRVYSLIVADVTDGCYRTCLPLFSPSARILDVGIGNGEMIRKYHELIQTKQLFITGLDIDSDYLAHCNHLICEHRLQENIRIEFTPVEEYVPPSPGYFDVVLFSMSFMLLADPQRVLRRIRPWLTTDGQVVFVQTMFTEASRLLELVKPRLKYLTTIDFGRVIYAREFLQLLHAEGFQIIEDRLIARKWFGGQYRMIRARA